MSKEQTAMLKGIAILMMLCLHLFSDPRFAGTATPLLWIGELPFVTVFTRACNPVGFFLICSGYGLSYAHLRRKLSYKGQMRRVWKLYLNYWLVLLVFVGMGSVWRPGTFAMDMQSLLGGITGWNVDPYDGPAWFLLPYCLLALSSPVVFRLMDRVGMKWALAVSMVLAYASMCVITWYIAPHKLYHEWYNVPIGYFNLLFSFVFGGVLCYLQEQGRLVVGWLRSRQYVLRLLVLMWFVVHCFVGSFAAKPIFQAVFMLLFVNLKVEGLCKKVLVELGNRSMMMWLVHCFIYSSLFHDFVYGFKYPLFIFLVLVVCSYVSAVVMMWLSDVTIGRLWHSNSKS